MRVGVQMPEVERVVRWPEIERMALAIEDAGFDAIWVGDHLLYDLPTGRAGPWEAFTQLAAIAAVTTSVGIGPLVAAQAFHAPAMLANQAATIDEISGGRLTLGLGAGWNRTEFEAFGFPFDRRVSRFEEGFEIVRRLLAGETVTHHGEFYDLEECVLLPPSTRPGGPPLLVGSNSPRMLSITIPHVAAWNTWFVHYDNDAARLPSLMDAVDRACESVGRDPVSVERTASALFQFEEGGDRRSSVNPITGSVDEMAAALDRLAGTGLSEVQAVLDPIDERSIDRMGAVVDRFRS